MDLVSHSYPNNRNGGKLLISQFFEDLYCLIIGGLWPGFPDRKLPLETFLLDYVQLQKISSNLIFIEIPEPDELSGRKDGKLQTKRLDVKGRTRRLVSQANRRYFSGHSGGEIFREGVGGDIHPECTPGAPQPDCTQCYLV